jgi:hypothetical protein
MYMFHLSNDRKEGSQLEKAREKEKRVAATWKAIGPNGAPFPNRK